VDIYKGYESMRNLVKTETNSRLFLDNPELKNGEFTEYVSYISYGTMEVITQPQILTTMGGAGPLHMLPWYIENMKGEGTRQSVELRWLEARS